MANRSRKRGGRKRETVTSSFFQPTALEAKLLDQTIAKPNILDSFNQSTSIKDAGDAVDNIAKAAFQVPQQQNWPDDLTALRMRTLVDQRISDERVGLLTWYVSMQNYDFFNHRALKDINSAYRSIPCDSKQRAELACLCARTYAANNLPDKALDCLPDIIKYSQESGGITSLQKSDALFAEGMQIVKDLIDTGDDKDSSATKDLIKRFSKIYSKLTLSENSEDDTGGSIGRAFDLAYLGDSLADISPSLNTARKVMRALGKKASKTTPKNWVYVYDSTTTSYIYLRSFYKIAVGRGSSTANTMKNTIVTMCKTILNNFDVLKKHMTLNERSLHVESETEAILNEVAA